MGLAYCNQLSTLSCPFKQSDKHDSPAFSTCIYLNSPSYGNMVPPPPGVGAQ